MSYPYVDRSIEGHLLVIESVDRVMPCISTLLEKGQILPPYYFVLLSYGCLFSLLSPFNAVALLPLSVWSFIQAFPYAPMVS